jgi:aryl-alcohol dehydrogenase-like predicted oxidoreductase
MELRPLGNTGLLVSPLGLGAGVIGDHEIPEEAAKELLFTALELGINFVDTAPSYGCSEERIGRHLSSRRRDFILSTKGGYGVEGQQDWTPGVITAGIEQALRVMKTDVIDVFHLHSCSKELTKNEDIGQALVRAKEAGKIRVIGYSGEGDALAAAVRSDPFGAVQCSVNLFDQYNLEDNLLRATHRGVGVIAKRPLANAVWRHLTWPEGDHAEYWERMHAMQLDPGPDGWLDLALRFSAFTPGVATAIVGTTSSSHLGQCADSIVKGDIGLDARRRIETSFSVKSRGWRGKV